MHDAAAAAVTEVEKETRRQSDAVRFLTALFQPGDTILFRPIETWTEGDKRNSRVDYAGISYHTVGLGVGRNGRTHYATFPARTAAAVARMTERAAAEKSNCFFGVCPRHAPGSDSSSFDLAWQIRTVRCLWADIDDVSGVDEALARCTSAGLPDPSIVVSSGHGVHLYWLLADPITIDTSPPAPVHTEFVDQGDGKKKRRRLWIAGENPGERLYLDVPTHRPALSAKAQSVQDTLAGIAAAIGGDHTTDLARILRVPGTLNRKNERNGKTPVPCELVTCDNARRYPFSLFARFEQASPQRRDRERIAKIPLPRQKKIGTRGQARLDTLISDCIAADTGSRSEADFALCCWAVEQGQSPDMIWQAVCGAGKFAEAGRRYFDLTWAAACAHTRERVYAEARAKIAKKADAKEKEKQQEGKDGLDHTVEDGSDLNEAPDDPHRLARINLERYATRTDGRTLRYWRDEWYVWKKNAYRHISKEELKAKLTASIREEFERLHAEEMDAHEASNGDGEPPAVRKVTPVILNSTMQATASLTIVSADTEPNTWLSDRRAQHFVSMANGILDLEAVLQDRDDYLLPNTPEWFSMVSLPYEFNPEATCPKWEAFLENNLELDPERIKVCQEWAGYLLLPDTGEQKFMVLEGEGANGKSVFIAALTAMLGEENVSNIGLENFSDRFARTDTLGKLLNAAGDCGELDKAAEGFLKSFTSGDRMYFDRKGIAGLNCRPTARLMVAANNRPRFSDHSQGLWRRMLLIPWRVEISREKRVRGMDKVEWWQDSGELPGILRWALVGLARLRSQRGFTESSVMKDVLQDYQEEMNPARVFLQENIEPEKNHSIRSKDLYRFYRRWCEESGYKPLADRNFGREIRRCFSGAQRKKSGTRAERFWIYDGLKFSQDEICGEKTEDYSLF